MPHLNPRLRRTLLTGLVILAVLMVSTVVWVMVTEDGPLDPDEAFDRMVHVDPLKRPEFVFPESKRTFDLSLNRFVDRFARICMDGRYADFRLMLSRRAGDPIAARRFESMFNALKQVRILALEKLPDLPGWDEPVYLMLVEYDLESYAVTRGEQTEQRQLAIIKEDGVWRIGPLPDEALAAIEALREAHTQPPENHVTTQADGGDAIKTPQTPNAAANRPASIDS